HHPLNAWERIESLFDKGTFQEWDRGLVSTNPLDFPGYEEKLDQDQQKTGLNEGVVTGKGLVEGQATAFAVMDARFRMGSMGSVIGEYMARSIEKERQVSLPFIMFTVYGGERMPEGVLSLLQIAKTSVPLKRCAAAGGFVILVMT